MLQVPRVLLQRWPTSGRAPILLWFVGLTIVLAGSAQARPWSVRAVRISGEEQRTQIILETDRSAAMKGLSDGRHGRLLVEVLGARGPVARGCGGTGRV